MYVITYSTQMVKKVNDDIFEGPLVFLESEKVLSEKMSTAWCQSSE